MGGARVGKPRWLRIFGVFFRECAFARQHLQEAGDDPREYRLKLFSGGGWDGLEERDPVGQAIDAIKHQAMEMNIKIGRNCAPVRADPGTCATNPVCRYKQKMEAIVRRDMQCRSRRLHRQLPPYQGISTS